MADTAKIEIGGKKFEFPIIKGTEGDLGIDITSLRRTTGYITLDEGYKNTGSCQSDITYLDGEQGILKYRGFSIEDLAENSNFIETAFLLINGNLPTRDQLNNFNTNMNSFTDIPIGLKSILDQFPVSAHPMCVIATAFSTMPAFYPEFCKDELSQEEQERLIALLMAQAKNISSYFYRRTKGQDPVRSKEVLSYAGDFLNMMFNKTGVDVNEDVASALDTLLLIHADHEQNCSTASVKIVGSSKTNVFTAISAGIGALWGKLHGGANQAVLEMLETIQQDGSDYKKYIEKAKDKNDPFRLMGFGHRVYKNFDPRAKIIKKACDTILDKLGVDDPLLDIAQGLSKEALSDPYFIERNLYPNVDFYSGIIYRALGIPTDMFTVMFVIGRLPGWFAQWKEMTDNPSSKICRPRQVYTGEVSRTYSPLSDR